MDSTLVELFRHNLWANLRLIDACARLDDAQLDASAPGTYGRVRDTLFHIIAAEERYVITLTGKLPERPLRSDDAFPGFEELRRRARGSGEELIEIAPRIQPTEILRGMRRDKAYAVQASIVLIQAINHATEHRAHVTTILSQLAIISPVLDAWMYGRELGVVDL